MESEEQRLANKIARIEERIEVLTGKIVAEIDKDNPNKEKLARWEKEREEAKREREKARREREREEARREREREEARRERERKEAKRERMKAELKEEVKGPNRPHVVDVIKERLAVLDREVER